MPPDEDRLSAAAKWGLTVTITLGLMVLLAGAAEIALRIRQTLRHGSATTVETQYRVDERIGLRVPIASLRLPHLQTNSLGFRGPEIVQPKPAGTTRLAFLGASTTWCAEVAGNDRVWPHLVTQQLQQAYPQARIDYVNGGVPGYTVASSARNLQHRVAPLAPDVIVIYHATNNLSGELRERAAARGLVPDAKMQAPLAIGNYSLLWNLAEKNARIWIAQQKAAANVGRLEVDPTTLGDEFRRDLTALVLAARRQSRVVALVTFSTQLRASQPPERQLQAAASALYYAPFVTPATLIQGYRRYNQIIAEVAAATGAVLIAGEDEIPGDHNHFTDTVHLSAAGAQAMARRVTGALATHPAMKALLSAAP